MSFLRSFRTNLILSTAPPPAPAAPHDRGTMRTSGSASSRGPTGTGAGRKNSATTSRTIVEEPEQRPLNGGRRSSSHSVQSRSGTTTKQQYQDRSSDRYGKENPAPIVVYLEKQPAGDGKSRQPASILRTHTFTRHDEEEPERVRHAITRSDTFTINETNDEPINTGTYTRPGKTIPPPPATDVFEPLYAKNISLSSQEKLPTVVDSRTYRRKKSLKSSKPVQKVESFIKRFERTLFHKGSGNAGDSKRQPRKGSTASEASTLAGPRFRDVGINCKLDEEEKFRAKLETIKQSRQSSRDSLVDQRERSLSPSKTRYPATTGAGTYDRRSSPSRSAGVMVQPLKEDEHGYGSGRDSVTPPPLVAAGLPGSRSTLYHRPTESSILKSKQKEIEMGYSVVHKRQTAGLSLPPPTEQQGAPDRGKALAEGSWRTGRELAEQPRERHNARYSTSRRDTYQTLKDEYEERQLQQAQSVTKPIGIASPRMSAVRPTHPSSSDGGPPSPLFAVRRKDSQPELPKYTFGADLQQRRSRFQQFQKSFKKMDDSASEVSVQQSFFVPI
uniref:Uncharacterized protein n=1 Tax=Anopheles melas TaxID=34690 RepID=A0A182U6Y8_9DIPT